MATYTPLPFAPKPFDQSQQQLRLVDLMYQAQLARIQKEQEARLQGAQMWTNLGLQLPQIVNTVEQNRIRQMQADADLIRANAYEQYMRDQAEMEQGRLLLGQQKAAYESVPGGAELPMDGLEDRFGPYAVGFTQTPLQDSVSERRVTPADTMTLSELSTTLPSRAFGTLPSRPMGLSVLPGMATETPTEFGGFATKPKSAEQLEAEAKREKADAEQASLEQIEPLLTPEQLRVLRVLQATRGLSLGSRVQELLANVPPEEKPEPQVNMSQLAALVASGKATPAQNKAYWDFRRQEEALKPRGSGAEAERKPPPQGTAEKMLEFRDGWSQLQSLRSLWPSDTTSSNYVEKRLPVEVLANMPNAIVRSTGLGAITKARGAIIATARQVIGKALEGGVLRKEDEAKYLLMLPALTDSAEIAQSKLDTLQTMLEERYNARLQYLEDTGYNIKGLANVRPQSGFEEYSQADKKYLEDRKYLEDLMKKRGGQ